MSITYKKLFTVVASWMILLSCSMYVNAAITYTGTTYTQDFNSLAGGGWANDSTLQGWSLFRQPAPGTAITSVTAGSGTSNAGAFYVFGQGDGDQALGGIGSGGNYWGSPSTNSLAGWMAVALTNGTDSAINEFDVLFDGEQWRQGGNTSQQTMVFEYGFGSTFASVGSWIAMGGTFDFVSPTTTGPTGAINGNDSINRVAGLGGTIAAAWTPGSTLWMRWIELNDGGNDHGLAIDNFSLSSETVVEPIETGDFDDDGDVDGRDFLAWQAGYGLSSPTLADGDGNGDDAVNNLDLEIWQEQYDVVPLATVHAVPEPTCLCLMTIAVAALSFRRVVTA